VPLDDTVQTRLRAKAAELGIEWVGASAGQGSRASGNLSS
jgi:hypothetical protein